MIEIEYTLLHRETKEISTRVFELESIEHGLEYVFKIGAYKIINRKVKT